ncbi:SufB/SufD family protein [Xylocopilactobacillus apicola]|uniref:Fe-S cluster assembly protein SufD n=1 Tax=Xylocopilactobacillus apicola TaxID=2932184 RepID=A0AAU9D0R1_9LACO|nr:SufD family Fe-S cluster assembly protein [Xylocopilactobacillus apicola]BDR58281.1 Fe-S cluster assembly protein SufD [Xylocopilactobacillus apicola]
MNDSSTSKQIEEFKNELIKSGSKDLSLPVFDQINVKSLQLMRLKKDFGSDSSISEPELTDDFGFVFANNQLTSLKIPTKYLDQGLVITDLKTAQAKYSELFRTYFAQLITAREDLLTYEHYCRLNGGVFIYVPDELKVNDTLQAYFSNNPNKSQSTQVILVVGKNAKLSMTENQVATELGVGDYSTFCEVYSQSGANLSYVVNDQAATDGHNYFYRSFNCGSRSVVNLTSGEFTKGNVLVNNKISLFGNDSTGEVKTVAIAQGDQTAAINSRVTNFGLRTRGNILQHGVILDQAKLVFNGIGQIVKGARGADSQQENRVLMLSKKARGDANPILLIDENDVTAGHAASVGRIDEEQLYYLESRGLNSDIAKRLIIKGFLESVITVVESKRTRSMLRSVIERSLGIADE